jgi:hypothetical protein
MKPFCSPLATVMVNGEQVVVVWFSQHLVMVKAVSGEAPALGTALAATVTTNGSPPSNNSAWEPDEEWGLAGTQR